MVLTKIKDTAGGSHSGPEYFRLCERSVGVQVGPRSQMRGCQTSTTARERSTQTGTPGTRRRR